MWLKIESVYAISSVPHGSEFPWTPMSSKYSDIVIWLLFSYYRSSAKEHHMQIHGDILHLHKEPLSNILRSICSYVNIAASINL